MDSRPVESYRLGDLVVDVRTRRVLRGGADLPVTRLSFDLLLALVRAAPAIVSFDNLMAQVWPGLVVSPETLTQRIKLLRQGLGDSAEQPRYILAVRGVGYRLLASAEPSAGFPEPTEGMSLDPARSTEMRGRVALARKLVIGVPVFAAIAAVAAWWLATQREAMPLQSSVDGDAYRYFQQAESVVNGTPESFQAAVSLYSEALAREPAFAAALSGRAMNRAALLWVGSPLARDIKEAQQDAEAALRLDSREARAHSVLGSIHALRGDWFAAEDSFKNALTISPGDAETLGRQAVSLLLATGQLEKAAAAGNEAVRLAPGSGFAESMLAFVEQARGRDAEAIRLAEGAIASGADRRQMAAVLATAAARQGRFEEAAEHAVQALPLLVRKAEGAQTVRAAYLALGDPSQQGAALGALRRFVRNTSWDSADPRSRQVVLYLFAAFDALDDLDGELQRVTRNIDGGNAQVIAIGSLWSPEMRSYRRDVRFQALAEGLNLIDYWRQTAPPDGCRFEGSVLYCN